MKQAPCPHCQAGVNRFYPKRVDLTRQKAWYVPVAIDRRIVCSSCRKPLRYRQLDTVTSLVLALPILMQAANLPFRESMAGRVFLVALILFVVYSFLVQSLAKSIYRLSDKQE